MGGNDFDYWIDPVNCVCWIDRLRIGVGTFPCKNLTATKVLEKFISHCK
jgi:hypothetical protein